MVAAMAVGLSGWLASAAPPADAPGVPFAAVGQPISVAADTEKVLVTAPFDAASPRYVYSINDQQVVTVFSPLPERTTPPDEGGWEDSVAISPGLGGFPAGWVYVTQGPNIYKIPPGGATDLSQVQLFATIPDLPGEHTDLLFDTVGTFDFDMIVLGGSSGLIYRVPPSGDEQLLVNHGPGRDIEGADVAPAAGFGPYSGCLIFACNDGVVHAVSPAGAVSEVATWPSVERINFVPEDLCTLGETTYSFFVAIYGANAINAFDASVFAGMGGKAFIHSEYVGAGGYALLGWDPTSPDANPQGYVVTPLWTITQQLEGSGFVYCHENFRVYVDVKPTSCPNPFNLERNGVMSVAVLGTEHFDVSRVNPATVRLDGIAPLRWSWEDVATPYLSDIPPTGCMDCTTGGPDGHMDLVLKFSNAAFAGTIGAYTDGECRVVRVTGTLLDGTPFDGQDVIRLQGKTAAER